MLGLKTGLQAARHHAIWLSAGIGQVAGENTLVASGDFCATFDPNENENAYDEEVRVSR